MVIILHCLDLFYWDLLWYLYYLSSSLSQADTISFFFKFFILWDCSSMRLFCSYELLLSWAYSRDERVSRFFWNIHRSTVDLGSMDLKFFEAFISTRYMDLNLYIHEIHHIMLNLYRGVVYFCRFWLNYDILHVFVLLHVYH